MKKKPSEIFEKSWERDLTRRGVLDGKAQNSNIKHLYPLPISHTVNGYSKINNMNTKQQAYQRCKEGKASKAELKILFEWACAEQREWTLFRRLIEKKLKCKHKWEVGTNGYTCKKCLMYKLS